MTPTSGRGPVATTRVIVDRYEALRRGALGAPLAPAARAGLAVLLCRGMWAWARAVANPPCARAAEAAHSLPAAGVAPAPRHHLAGLLAELALAHSGRNL